MNLKAKIAQNFSASSGRYDQYAIMQQQAALSMVRRLADLGQELPPGPILEVGCGTGAVSRELAILFPERPLTLVDIAPGMIAENRKVLTASLEDTRQIDWQVADAETLDCRSHYSLITSCLTLQWFQDLSGSLARLGAALVPGGLLLCSYLGDHSFPEWRRVCMDMGLPCTMNRLPNSRVVLGTLHALGLEASEWNERIELQYPSALDFFRSLKKTGANTHAAEGRLTLTQMAGLLAAWPRNTQGKVSITYHINSILAWA